MDTTNVQRKPILSAKQLMDKMGTGEKMVLSCNGWIETFVDGSKTKTGKKFTSYQIILLGDDMNVSFSSQVKELPPDGTSYVASAGWKMLKRQQKFFKEQYPNLGELNHYRIKVELEKKELNGSEFLSARVLPEIGARVYTPTQGGFVFEHKEGDTAFQLEQKAH
jgi:hypothetical protein